MSGPERAECVLVGVRKFVCQFVCTGACGTALVCASAAPTPAAARFIRLHTCVSVNVDSVTHWASHTFQNKRLPPRITIDPCGALSCIWKERERERDHTTSSLAPSVSACLLRNVMCLPVCRKSVRDDLETQSTKLLQ